MIKPRQLNEGEVFRGLGTIERKLKIDTRRVESYWRHLAWAENSELAGRALNAITRKIFRSHARQPNHRSHQTTTYSDLGAG